ncbi:MAG TPA: stealth family protein [Trebonia sp.]|nr:stealth family protein [Trebonia sp.]
MSLVPFVHPETKADLQAMHDLLAAAGLSFWLVRHAWGVAVAVADSSPGAGAAEHAIHQLARPGGLRRAEAVPGVARVGLSADPGRWVEVERWTIGPLLVTCPRANALTREQFDAADMEPAVVELFGRQWPTLAGMFGAHPGDVGFDVDVVFSWVDGSDPVLSSARARWRAHVVLGEGDGAAARTRQIDELRYALRSVYQNAPWVRRIFIATDSRLPGWLAADHPRVTVVRSAEHFADPGALPTFNSHAVESQLHHIEGLAEHFVYCNDDMFIGRPVAPSMFFSAAGISRFIESPVRIGGGAVSIGRSGHENAARNNRRLLASRFGCVITRHLAHAPAPLRRSVLAELEAEFPVDFAATAASRFRSATDISVTNSLYHYYALLTGRAVPRESARARYVETTSAAGLAELAELAERPDADFFCLNDGGTPEVDDAHRAATVSGFLARYFPYPAPWEADRAGHRPRAADWSRPGTAGLAGRASG